MKYEWKNSNGQPYLVAEADNHYDLGLATGHGMSKQISASRSRILARKEYFEKAAGGKEQLQAMIDGYESFFTGKYLDEVRGICDGYQAETGEEFPLKEAMMHSYCIDLLYQFSEYMQNDPDGCTNFGVINVDGTVTHGQNYDSDPASNCCNAFVLQKVKGEQTEFVYHNGASLGMALGKNEAGVAMTVSVIKSYLRADIITPRAITLREALQKETALETATAMHDEKGRSPFSYNLVISDPKTIVSTQSTPFETRMTQVKRTIVQSNQYDYVDWIKYLLVPSYSKKRQFYAENLLETFRSRYGIVTDDDLLEILRDEPTICRKIAGDGLGTTCLFMTRESFGHGNALDNPVGKMPL